VPRKEESYLVLDGRHLVKDGQHVKHNDRGAGWRSMVGSNIPPHAHLVTISGVVFRASLVSLCRTHAMTGGGGLHYFLAFRLLSPPPAFHRVSCGPRFSGDRLGSASTTQGNFGGLWIVIAVWLRVLGVDVSLLYKAGKWRGK